MGYEEEHETEIETQRYGEGVDLSTWRSELEREGLVIGGQDQVNPATFGAKVKGRLGGTPLERD